MHLTPKGLVIKPIKKDRCVFDRSFKISPTSTCINDFTSTANKIDLKYGSAFIRYLSRIFNLRISYATLEILIFDDNATWTFRYIKLHSNITRIYYFIIKDTLYISLESVFSSNISLYNWKVIA